jgi:type I restriction enzyme M protein
MANSASVRRLWGYCNVLRDDGMSYGDYADQLAYLLFLKMTDVGRGLFFTPTHFGDG